MRCLLATVIPDNSCLHSCGARNKRTSSLQWDGAGPWKGTKTVNPYIHTVLSFDSRGTLSPV